MPLSEHEQRLLDQIERGLISEDPKFASTVRSSDLRTHHIRRIRYAALVLVVGLLVLLTGAVAGLPAVGVIGFIVMLVAAMRLASVGKALTGRAQPHIKTPRKSHAGRRGFAQRSEDRLRRRLDGDGF